MRTQRTSSWLLTSLLSFVVVVLLLPAVRGQAPRDTPLVDAARHDDLQAVRALIARRANVNEHARDGSTAILWAAANSNLEMARALIAAGAAVNTPNHYGITPLLQASRSGDAPLVAALLKAGADHAAGHPDGETPLMAASRSGRVEAVRLLLEAGSNVNAAEAYQHQTALMWAAGEGHVDVVKALLAAGANPNQKARVNAINERKHADHPTGGFTALMFAARNGHGEIARALVEGGADPNLTNGDGATATIVAIVNDRFDLARQLLDLGADANDGSLYFAVDMHDATIDMRARDGSRLRANHPNKLTALDLVTLLLDRGADPNKPFVGQLHSTSYCCGDDVNSSAFYRAAIASDVEVLKLMIARGARIEWSPSEVKKEGAAAGRGANANVGRTPIVVAMAGGRGAPLAGGPGFDRIGPPPFREPSSRDPLEALEVLLAAGASPNVKAPDGSTPLHQAVQARQVAMIRTLVAAGASLNATNKDNLTPLQLAEKPEPPGPATPVDPGVFRPKRDTREEVIAALRELMKLGPNDPTPVPPPAPAEPGKEKEAENKKGDQK
ncbi:MAG TPA: ankyrin repeat domain-containing protein [Vicinamibacterales bacterium]|nr:ankyrin repeat domain-containing protein [Vicinamibacterales bacterium]